MIVADDAILEISTSSKNEHSKRKEITMKFETGLKRDNLRQRFFARQDVEKTSSCVKLHIDVCASSMDFNRPMSK